MISTTSLEFFMRFPIGTQRKGIPRSQYQNTSSSNEYFFRYWISFCSHSAFFHFLRDHLKLSNFHPFVCSFFLVFLWFICFCDDGGKFKQSWKRGDPWALFTNVDEWAYLSDVACSDCSAYPFFRLLLRKRIELIHPYVPDQYTATVLTLTPLPWLACFR